MADRRRSFGPVVLLGLGGGTLAAVGGNRQAVTGEASSANLKLTFDGSMPLVTALALVALASWGVLLVTRGRVRRAMAALGTLAAAGALAAAIAAYPQVSDDLREQLQQLGIDNGDVGPTGWYWAALLGTVLALVAGVLATLWCRAWPEMGRRYDAPTGAVPVVEAPPEEQSSLDLWKALDEGRDPTAPKTDEA
ncbi:Trp biosynthesis-associated membrane protein [Nocardioides sp. SR21]|uniref:Trp biosynthesis-associated membrane protein n=1 Tax=Nocardioides sp. SR21 TaxID=2919501 RepID=UPI001FA9A603|nr:Trp biosynthesis-associated membrane protein [Nocardioides sp. SR21]